jgi:flagellar motor switch protein FliM
MTRGPLSGPEGDLPVEEMMIRAAAAQPLRLERLDAALDRFGAAVGPALSEQSGANLVSWLDRVAYVTCAEAVSGAEGAFAVAEVNPWSGVLHLRMDHGIMTGLLDRLLPSVPEEEGQADRHLSPIERRIGLRMLDRALGVLVEEMSSIRRLAGRVLEVKDELAESDLGAADERCVVARFCLDLDGRVGAMDLLMPFGLFGADIDMLSRPNRPHLVPEAGGWREEMSRMITSAGVTVSAVLGHGCVRLGDALAWQAGTTLDLGVEASQPVNLSVGGRPIFRGAAGRRTNGYMAVKISEELEKAEVTGR